MSSHSILDTSPDGDATLRLNSATLTASRIAKGEAIANANAPLPPTAQVLDFGFWIGSALKGRSLQLIRKLGR